MSAPHYPEPVSADAETMTTPNPKEKSDSRVWTPGFIAVVVLANLVQWLTDWSWWVLWAPAAAISGCILVYAWAKRRRGAARAAAAR